MSAEWTYKLTSTTQGLTLLELLIVIFLISLIGAFSLPLNAHWYQEHLVWMIEKDIEQAIEEGMQDSMILGEPLRLTPIDAHNWSTGLMLVSERDPKNTIHIWRWSNTAYHIIWHGFLDNTYIRFTPDISQAAMNGYFLIENQTDQGVKMVVNRIGRIRTMPI